MSDNISNHILSYMDRIFNNNDCVISPPHFACYIIKFYYKKGIKYDELIQNMFDDLHKNVNKVIILALQYSINYAFLISVNKIQNKHKIQSDNVYKNTREKLIQKMLNSWSDFCDFVRIICEDSDPISVQDIDYI